MNALGLKDFPEYKTWLAAHPAEWNILDEMCRITISRFYRDWAVFDHLKDELLPQLAEQAIRENRPLRCWSAGCASGEEPYTLALIGHFVLKKKFPKLDFQIVATDINATVLERAKTGCYAFGTLKGLPEEWLEKAFAKKNSLYCIHPHFSGSIQWIQQDIRKALPEGMFDLIFCRNLVATYFETALQIKVFEQMKTVLRSEGVLVLGSHEKLPDELTGIAPKSEKLNIFRKG